MKMRLRKKLKPYSGPPSSFCIWRGSNPNILLSFKDKTNNNNFIKKKFKICKECGCLTYKERCEFCDLRTKTS